LSVLRRVGRVLRRKKDVKKEKLGLLIDGTNLLEKNIEVDLEKIDETIATIGDLRIAKVILDQQMPDTYIDQILKKGYLPIVVPGDIDVYMSIEAMDLIYSDELEMIAFWTSDINFLPIIIKAKELGKETVVLGRKEGFSETLENAVDYILILSEETIAAE
jgi:uncharacterized protein (TIGR00288 family)